MRDRSGAGEVTGELRLGVASGCDAEVAAPRADLVRLIAKAGAWVGRAELGGAQARLYAVEAEQLLGSVTDVLREPSLELTRRQLRGRGGSVDAPGPSQGLI